APGAQRAQLVLRVLAFLVGTDASVDSYAHKHGSFASGRTGPFFTCSFALVKRPVHAGFLVRILPTLFPCWSRSAMFLRRGAAGLDARLIARRTPRRAGR